MLNLAEPSLCTKAFSPEPRGDCSMVKPSTLPLSQQLDQCRRPSAWTDCEPATLHSRQKMQSMQGIQPSETGLLLSPTALCPQTLHVLIIFIPFVITSRYFFRRGQLQPPLRSHPWPRQSVSGQLTSERAWGKCHRKSGK